MENNKKRVKRIIKIDKQDFDLGLSEIDKNLEKEPKKRLKKVAENSGTKYPRKKVKVKKVKSKGGCFWRLISFLFWVSIALGGFGALMAWGAYSYYAQDLPKVDSLKNYAPKTVTFFYSDDGRVIGEYSSEKRFVKKLNEIPKHVQDAFLAVEDTGFYEHKGISYRGILRAAVANYKSGVPSQGASTITQQVTRSFFLTPEVSYVRKIKEMILAFRIEKVLTKDEILYLYLNQIYLGEGAYGVEAAARIYFDKHVENLTIAEAAVLAGITHSPSSKNPVKNPKEARDRQLHALGRMEWAGFISKIEAQNAKDEVLNVKTTIENPNTTVTPYFTEYVRILLEKKYGKDSLYNDGWQVYTTVNIEDQEAADKAAAQGLWEYARRRGFRGAVANLKNEEEIKSFLNKVGQQLPVGGLKPSKLYQAVITELDTKGNFIKVKVGPYSGEISKDNFKWILAKGSLAKQLKNGDVVWVRLSEKTVKAGEKAETKEALTIEDIARQSSAEIASTEIKSTLPLILEQETDLEVALLSMNVKDGSVNAMVGGRDFNRSQFNRAILSKRQPGSSFKPIVYTSAMDNGFTPGSVMLDAPFVVDDLGSNRRWKPVNADLKFRGPMTLYSALVSSRNLISVKILDRIGLEALQTTAYAMGITEKLPQSLTVALGSHGLTMPELVTAFSTFPNMGKRVEPRYIVRIEDRNGKVVETFEPKFYQAVSGGTACAVHSMLVGAVSGGTGTSVKPLNRPVAGKTGTTNDYSDAWFIGYTPEYVASVWVGTDELKARAVGEVGGRAAAPIFLYYMQSILKNVPMTEFMFPKDAVMSGNVCYKAGTVGTGISEIAPEASPEEDFLRDDFEDIF